MFYAEYIFLFLPHNFSAWLNNTRIYNIDVLAKIIDTKSKDIPLLTLSNHHSCFDDPGIWGNSCCWQWFAYITDSLNFFFCCFLGVLPIRHNCNYRKIRWSLAAHDICFTKSYHSHFFLHGTYG